MATKSPPTAPKRVYQLLIELDEVEPRVWRRLWVTDTLTLAKLDRVIQAAMGWTMPIRFAPNDTIHGGYGFAALVG